LKGKKLVIIGGCGHVGLPLGVRFAQAGLKVTLIDIDPAKCEKVNGGEFPFLEKNGDVELAEALRLGLKATTDIKACSAADIVVFVTGTPVDEHLNPKLTEVLKIFDSYSEYISEGTLVVMRSTLFPGTMSHLYERANRSGKSLQITFCPERVSQGAALEETGTLPQIVSAFEDSAFHAAYKLFATIAPKIIRLTPLEAELTKLMNNAWRYLEFAIANQFYMIAEESGVDFHRIYQAIRLDYPRANGYKAPGFAAGPCLFKDTMQLASYFQHHFYFGHTAMLVNEGLADTVVKKATNAVGGKLWGKKVGLLGMTFKANNDDIRESLSFRVKKGIEFSGGEVLWHDPYLPDSTDLDTVLSKSDVIVMGMPHKEYLNLNFRKPVVDCWGVVNKPKVEVFPGKEA